MLNNAQIQFCQKDLKSLGKSSVNYFLEIPITGQLRTFFARQKFNSYIQYRFKRVKKVKSNIKDVYDGQLYKNLTDKGILSSPDNVSFLFNTDGAPVF